MTTFDAKRTGTGTNEWAENTVNIQIGCQNNCLYCYASDKASKMYGGWCKRDDWPNERLTKNANMKSYPDTGGVVMFPSTHDITPFNLDEYIRVARIILAKNNRLLIVSKPRIACIQEIAIQLEDYRDKILFRFTIGSMNKTHTDFWEPGAPDPIERLVCLSLAQLCGFRTSVSIEPMLRGFHETVAVVNAVDDYVTDTIWIGKMNKALTRVDGKYADKVAEIHRLQSDFEIISLYEELKGNPKVRWKDSINEVINRR